MISLFCLGKLSFYPSGLGASLSCCESDLILLPYAHSPYKKVSVEAEGFIGFSARNFISHLSVGETFYNASRIAALLRIHNEKTSMHVLFVGVQHVKRSA